MYPSPPRLRKCRTPYQREQLRTGHWALEHFLTYFAATSIVCFGWYRPLVVAGGLGAIAAPLLEALQSFEPTHSANCLSVVSGLAEPSQRL